MPRNFLAPNFLSANFLALIFWSTNFLAPIFVGGGQKILKIIYESLILQIYNPARNRKAIFWLLPAMFVVLLLMLNRLAESYGDLSGSYGFSFFFQMNRSLLGAKLWK